MKEKFLTKYPEANIEALDKYLEWLTSVDDSGADVKDSHHILPRCLFPEFDFLESNRKQLSIKNHLIAHHMLCRILPNNLKLAYAYEFMWGKKFRFGLDFELSEEFIQSLTHSRKLRSSYLKTTIFVRDKENKAYRVLKDDPRYLSGELVPYGTGQIPKTKVKGLAMVRHFKTGEATRICIKDPRYLSGEFIPYTTGKISVKDEKGNCFLVEAKDPRYLSGELKAPSKGQITLRDKEGNCFNTNKDDPRYLSGELHGHAYKTMIAKDKDGNRFQIRTDDPRYLSGELKHICAGTTSAREVSTGKCFRVEMNDPRFKTGELVGVTAGKARKK